MSPKEDDYVEKIRKLLKEQYWLPTLHSRISYTRVQDDCDGDFSQQLSVSFSEDGDAWIQTFAPMGRALRFRTEYGGGGMSPRVRAALVILAEAIRLDNEKRPQNWKD